MKRYPFIAAALACGLFGAAQIVTPQTAGGGPEWSLNASIIEACSCPMFCQCYFGAKPAEHTGHDGHGSTGHFCRFNNAFRVNKGNGRLQLFLDVRCGLRSLFRGRHFPHPPQSICGRETVQE